MKYFSGAPAHVVLFSQTRTSAVSYRSTQKVKTVSTHNELFKLLCLHRRQLEVHSRQIRYLMYLPNDNDSNRYVEVEWQFELVGNPS